MTRKKCKSYKNIKDQLKRLRIIFNLKYIVPKFELMHIFGNIKFTLLQEK